MHCPPYHFLALCFKLFPNPQYQNRASTPLTLKFSCVSLAIKMASVVPLPNCMSSISVCCRILCSKILYMTSHSILQQFDPSVRCIIIHCKCVCNKSDICCFREMTSMNVAVTLGCKLASFTVNIYCYIAKVYFVMSIFICAFFSCEWRE